MRRIGVSNALVLLALLLTIAYPSWAQSQSDAPLTNSDLIRLVKAGLSEGTILRVMQVSETSFTTTADALINLKHRRVPDRVIDALLESRGGGVPNQSESPDWSSSEAPITGSHRLPNFDASMRLNGKSKTKIAVRQNYINVENAGHPLFSLSWKENGSN